MGDRVAAKVGARVYRDGRAALIEDIRKALEELHTNGLPRPCCHRGCAGCPAEMEERP
jgi:hypothetical protein